MATHQADTRKSTRSTRHDFRTQAAAVQAYGQRPGGEFLRIADEWLRLARELDVADLGRLGPEANGNVVRRVLMPSGEQAVLKVSVTDAFDEPLVLAHFAPAGVCADVLGFGVTPMLGRPWVLTAMVEGGEPDPGLLSTALAARVAARLRSSSSTSVPPRLGNVYAQITAWRALEGSRLGRQITTRLFDLTEGQQASPCHRTVVAHGDMRRRNLVQNQEGRLIVIDPTGLLAPAEFDIATWVGIDAAMGHLDAQEAMEVALAVDEELCAQHLKLWIAAWMLRLALSGKHAKDFLGREPVDVLNSVRTLMCRD